MAVTLKGQTAVYEGTSTDTKPTDADNNAIFKELDTGIRYYYDGTDWNEIPRSGGGGGGFTPTETQLAAMNSGITEAKVTGYDALPNDEDVKDIVSDHFVAGSNITITDNVDGTQTIASTASGGTTDYSDLTNKPSINNVTLSGNKTTSDLGIAEVPTITSSDGGKYLRANYYNATNTSDYSWANISSTDVINVLSTAQQGAINSGIDSTKVAQIETNKNNISLNTQNGVKNLFNLTKASGTYNTVVFTVNSDKTVTINGTASPSNSVFNLDDWTCTKAGTYVVSGAPSGGSWAPSPNTYRMRVAVNGTWKGDDVGNGFALTLAVGDVINLQINTSTSYTANNLVFKPMICEKSLYDVSPTYQFYAMSNAELTAAIQAIQAQLANQ